MIREGQKIMARPGQTGKAFVTFKGEKYFPNLSILFGIFFLILSLAIVLFHLTKKWTAPEAKISDTIFLSFMLVLQIVLIKAGIFISEAINRALPLFSAEACFYAIPFAAGAMLIGVLDQPERSADLLYFFVLSGCVSLQWQNYYNAFFFPRKCSGILSNGMLQKAIGIFKSWSFIGAAKFRCYFFAVPLISVKHYCLGQYPYNARYGLYGRHCFRNHRGRNHTSL